MTTVLSKEVNEPSSEEVIGSLGPECYEGMESIVSMLNAARCVSEAMDRTVLEDVLVKAPPSRQGSIK